MPIALSNSRVGTFDHYIDQPYSPEGSTTNLLKGDGEWHVVDSGIDPATVATNANALTLTNKSINGSSNTLTNLPAAGILGVIPIANLATGTPTGSKFIRDDGTLQTVSSGTTINPTNGAIPYRSSSSAFGDSPVVRADANTIWQRNSTNGQAFLLAGTYTDDSNYTALGFSVNPAGAGTIQMSNAGAGPAGALTVIAEDFLANNSVNLKTLGGGQVQMQSLDSAAASRALDIRLNDGDRGIDLSGNLTVSTGGATVSGTNTGDQDLSGLVPTTRTVNGHPLSANVTVTPTDLGLVIGTNVQAYDADLTTWAGKTPYVGDLVIASGKTQTTLENVTLTSDGVGTRTLNVGTGGTLGTAAYTAATASVTGLRKGAGAASADTAATVEVDYVTPTKAAIRVYVKSLAVLTSGAPADIGTITIPAGVAARYLIPNHSGAYIIYAETAAGSLAAGTFTIRDAAAGGGSAMTIASVAGPTAAGGVVSSSGAVTVSTSTTLHVRQGVNSANAGTCSFYLTLNPIP